MFKPDNISTPIPFNANVSDEIALAEGDEAADRIVSGATLVDHLKVGRALLVGSRIAAKEAGTDQGKPYALAYSKWLQAHPKLRAVNGPNRAAALWCLNEMNWPRVEKYLATLDVEERQTISLRTVRRRLDVPPPPPPTPKQLPVVEPKPVAAPMAQPAAAPRPDRVGEDADRAEIVTLKKEVWRLRDKLDQLKIFLVKEPPPKAEDRPFVSVEGRAMWMPGTGERPKDVQPFSFVNPPANDPDFALRKEEFEQWLVRRKEALENKFRAREDELAKAFDAKVKKAVEARIARESRQSRVLTDAQFMQFAACFHTDRRKQMTERDWDRTFTSFMSLRNRLVKANGTTKRKPPAADAPKPTPEPPREEEPPARSTGRLA